MKSIRRAAFVGISSVLALIAAGCSAVDGGQSGSGQGSPIPVGTIGTYSGTSGKPDGRAVMDAWAQAVNAAGGIDGHPIKLYIEDTGGNGAAGLTAAKKLIQQNKVVAIVGTSDNVATWIPYADSMGVPIVGGFPALPAALTDPNVFSVSGNLLSSFYGVVSEAKNYGDKTAILYCAETPACESAAGIEQQLGKSVGVSVVYSGNAMR
jgi:branched-chain amino acid transport system substrate-binding protein